MTRPPRTRLPLVGLALLALSLAAFPFVGCGEPLPWNVVVVTLDTTRADRLGCYGWENAGTPHLDRLAAEGFLFENAFSTAPITLPSHSTIFTGRYPLAHGVRDNGLFRLPESETTLAERLRDRGYATAAAIGSFPLTRGFGIDQGFDFFDDHITLNMEDFRGRRVEPRRGVYFDERPSAQVNDAILPWLRENAERPFFAWLHYWDPHQPHIPPAPFDQVYLHDLYQGEIAFADQSLGTVLRTLEELGVAERTLIVVVGDHGEGLGDHREETHSMLAYDSTLRVPMILRVPGLEGGHRLARRVGTVDLLPTLLDLLGSEPDPAVQGRSLAPWIRDPATPFPLREPHYAETLSPRLSHGWGELRALYDGPLKYIHGPRPELFDLEQDPGERDDLSAERPEDMAGMRTRLETFLKHRAEAAASGAVQEMDAETRQRLAALGYLSSGGESPASVVEELVEGGIPPQDRIRDVNLMSQAKRAIDSGDYAAARDLTLRLIQLDPQNIFYRGLLATALLGLGEPGEAAGVVEASAHLSSQNQSAFLAVAQRLFSAGDEARALALVRRINAEQDSAYGRYLLGEMLMARGVKKEGEIELAAAVELDPGFHRAQLSYGIHLAATGRHAEAEAVFESLLRRHPLSERGHYNYAVLLFQTGRWDLAMEHLERSIELAPSYCPPQLARLAAFVERDETDRGDEALDEMERTCRDPQTLTRAHRIAGRSP